MRLYLLIPILLLTACDVTVMPRSYYEKLPEKRIATVDDDKVNVVQEGFGNWVAWSGTMGRDRYAQYREQRAIELVSKCRVDKVQSKKTDQVTVASVRC